VHTSNLGACYKPLYTEPDLAMDKPSSRPGSPRGVVLKRSQGTPGTKTEPRYSKVTYM